MAVGVLTQHFHTVVPSVGGRNIVDPQAGAAQAAYPPGKRRHDVKTPVYLESDQLLWLPVKKPFYVNHSLADVLNYFPSQLKVTPRADIDDGAFRGRGWGPVNP